MSEKIKKRDSAPFLYTGYGAGKIVFLVFGSLLVLAGIYSFFYERSFILRFFYLSATGLFLELAYYLLAYGKFGLSSGSSAITSAILILSIPPDVPFLPVLFSLIGGVFLAKLPGTEKELHLNPALVSRLFLMLCYPQETGAWKSFDSGAEGLTQATPLELFHNEEAKYGLWKIFCGKIGGDWEGLYQLVPGSPGEMFVPAVIFFGAVFTLMGILKWQSSMSFLFFFCLANFFMRTDVLYNLFTGGVIFSAVYIAGDPKTMPRSIGGRILGGMTAGIANAIIRKHTYYAEGIVFSFLIANLLSPSFDRLAFFLKGLYLLKKQK